MLPGRILRPYRIDSIQATTIRGSTSFHLFVLFSMSNCCPRNRVLSSLSRVLRRTQILFRSCIVYQQAALTDAVPLHDTISSKL